MSKSAVVAVVLAVIVLGGGGALLVAHNNSNDNKKSDTNMSNMDNNSNSSNNSEKTATNSVTIENFAFSPTNITVKKGTTVTWTNKDGATHTVTSTSGPKSFDSSDLADGKSYSFTFDTVGTYEYHCSIHSSMKGSVKVTE